MWYMYFVGAGGQKVYQVRIIHVTVNWAPLDVSQRVSTQNDGFVFWAAPKNLVSATPEHTRRSNPVNIKPDDDWQHIILKVWYA